MYVAQLITRTTLRSPAADCISHSLPRGRVGVRGLQINMHRPCLSLRPPHHILLHAFPLRSIHRTAACRPGWLSGSHTLEPPSSSLAFRTTSSPVLTQPPLDPHARPPSPPPLSSSSWASSCASSYRSTSSSFPLLTHSHTLTPSISHRVTRPPPACLASVLRHIHPPRRKTCSVQWKMRPVNMVPIIPQGKSGRRS